MNHLKKKAAVKKFGSNGTIYYSVDEFKKAVREEYPEATDEDIIEIVTASAVKTEQTPEQSDELKAALARIAELEGKQSGGSIKAAVSEVQTASLNKWFDLWKGNLELFKPRTIQGTGQTMYREIQFQLEGSKPKKSVSVPQAVADEWNKTHFTVRKQSTEMLLPQGRKLDYWWIWNENTESYDFIVKELETA